MYVQMVRVTGMPNNVLVWVADEGPQAVVYVDKSLYEGDDLTSDGMIRVKRAACEQRALVEIQHNRPVLYAVAG